MDALKNILESFEKFKLERKKYDRLVGRVYKVGTVLFLAYVSASLLSTLVMVLLVDQATVVPRKAVASASRPVRVSSRVNYHSIRKEVLGRNIFNKEGEFPDEPDPGEENSIVSSKFDDAAPCRKSTLPIDLIGTIYLGETGESIATIQEKGYNQADVYRTGDGIIGNEQAVIYKIEQKKVILNNNGAKECLELVPPKPSSSSYAQAPVQNQPGIPQAASGDCANVTLKESYVRKEIGEGFQEILKKGRLIPHNRDNQMLGFKLIGVNPNSLFGKICLKNGDVITQVNDRSMQQPDQGFALYEALSDEREVRISYLRGGSDPTTITVQIK